MTARFATIPFYKLQGSGNDFIFIDNRELGFPKQSMPLLAAKACKRAFGVGADGMVFLENPGPGVEADYVWHFYNSDGSRAEMCGNASRCAAILAFNLGLAPKKHVIGTDAGPVRAEVFPETGEVEVELTTPKDLALNLEILADDANLTLHFVNTGVPHAVIVEPDNSKSDVALMGRLVRFHEKFAPAGTNVNFITVKDRRNILLRTYERGVEAETFACGTGAAAAAVVARELGLAEDQVALTTSGGEHLGISIKNNKVFLRGKALLVYTGNLNTGSLELEIH